MNELSATTLVDAPPRAVSAALTEAALLGPAATGSAVEAGLLAPGAVLPVLGRRLRVAEVGLAGLRLVPVGPGFGLTVRLAPTPTGVLVTSTVRWRPGWPGARRRLRGLLDPIGARLRSRAGELAAARVVVGTAIVLDRAVLAQQRAYPASAAGRWELPGGRVEPGEADPAAVVRECVEELGVTVLVGAPVGPDVALPAGQVLRVYRARLADPAAVPRPHDHQAVRWLPAGRLGQLDWLPADRVLLPALRRSLLAETPAGADQPPA